MMNGPASQSMREKGIEYHLNWGVPFMQLRSMAKEIGQDYHLAIALWKEDIRECKILATLVMPHDAIPLDIAELWMEQTKSQSSRMFAPMRAVAGRVRRWFDERKNTICLVKFYKN